MKLIVFDWDQTLWNSWDVHVQAAEYAAAVLALPIPSKQWIASTFSEPFPRHMELIFPNNTPKATRRYKSFYHSRVGELGHLFEGVPETLETLKTRGYLVALLSDKRQVYGARELKTTGIGDLFDFVHFLDGTRAYKPSPHGLQQVVEALGAKVEESLYVGDSYVDVQCARRAGVASAAALWGSVNVDAVLEEGPDHVLRTVPDVLTFLDPDISP